MAQHISTTDYFCWNQYISINVAASIIAALGGNGGSGSAELVSLGAVIPFLAVLSDPDRCVAAGALWLFGRLTSQANF